MSDQDSPEEHLFTGWEPDAPIGDPVLRESIFTLGQDMQSHTVSVGGRAINREDMIGGVFDRSNTYWNGVVLTQPIDAESLEERMTSWSQEFDIDGKSSGTVWVFSPWPTPDLRPWGWSLAGHPPLHFRPPGGPAPAQKPGFDIVPVETVEQLIAWERTAIESFPLPEMETNSPLTMAPKSLLENPRHQMWNAMIDDRVVGVAATTIANGLNYVGLVSTCEDARGKGIGTSLTWTATTARPELPAILLSSDEGRPVYDKLGYYVLLRFTLWYRERP